MKIANPYNFNKDFDKWLQYERLLQSFKSESELTEWYKSCIITMDDKYVFKYDFSREFEECNCNYIDAILRKNDVVPPGTTDDNDPYSLAYSFDFEVFANQFCEDLAEFIIKRRQLAEDYGLKIF